MVVLVECSDGSDASMVVMVVMMDVLVVLIRKKMMPILSSCQNVSSPTVCTNC